jgi:integrase
MAILQAEYNQPDRHPVYVFTYHAARTKHVNKTGRKLIRGSRYPITYSYWNTAWDRALAKLGMQGKVRLHDWRHTFATRLANSVNARNVQAAMDHAKIETTMGYISVDDDAIRAALDDTPMPMPLMPNDGVAPISAPKNKRFG